MGFVSILVVCGFSWPAPIVLSMLWYKYFVVAYKGRRLEVAFSHCIVRIHIFKFVRVAVHHTASSIHKGRETRAGTLLEGSDG